MTAYIAIFFSSMVVALSGAMMPGPLLTLNISESARRGVIAGPLLMAGHAILELILLISLFAGLGPFLKNEILFVAIALVGGSIMLWMAYGMFRSLPTLTVQQQANEQKKDNLIVAGALISLANPYWIIWWATIGIGYILKSQEFGVMGVSVFYVGHILGDVLWYVAVSVAVAKGKKLFSDTVYRGLIAVCGAFLVVFSLYLVWSGISKWL
jgi:threonine/homoserine/homoserine lactone efflux protein